MTNLPSGVGGCKNPSKQDKEMRCPSSRGLVPSVQGFGLIGYNPRMLEDV